MNFSRSGKSQGARETLKGPNKLEKWGKLKKMAMAVVRKYAYSAKEDRI